jgi:hypothetical protein
MTGAAISRAPQPAVSSTTVEATTNFVKWAEASQILYIHCDSSLFGLSTLQRIDGDAIS